MSLRSNSYRSDRSIESCSVCSLKCRLATTTQESNSGAGGTSTSPSDGGEHPSQQENHNLNQGTFTGTSQEQNLAFNETDQYKMEVPSNLDATFNVAKYSDANLQNFFSRPIKVLGLEWGVTGGVSTRFDPWSAYFENARVSNRISNYNLLRATLHVKFVLNGTPFHYGLVMCSYNPYDVYDDFTRKAAYNNADFVEMSQRPHIFLDPTHSQGGELVLPFVYHKNWLSIPASEWDEMGMIDMEDMEVLGCANGGTDPVTIAIFVWATDVLLSVPTSVEPSTIGPQMGRRSKASTSDEYGDGIISRPAAIVAKAAGLLENVPLIGPYAKATQMASNAVGYIASLFGFSRPVQLKPPVYYKGMPVGNLAATDLEEACCKLALDSKQELTVDPAVVGLSDHDEMTITSIATRESYLTRFQWAETDASEAILFSCNVTPQIWNQVGLENHMPACCFASLPFRHWHGTMRYRFQFVCSDYHKGRVKLVYDPQTTATNEYNVAYTRVVDLSVDRDFSLDVSWGSHTTFLKMNGIAGFTPSYRTDGTAQGAAVSVANGTLSVQVVTKLTTPATAANPFYVNVYVSMLDDVVFANPHDRNLQGLSWFPDPVPQSGTRKKERKPAFVFNNKLDAFLPQGNKNSSCRSTVAVNPTIQLKSRDLAKVSEKRLKPGGEKLDHKIVKRTTLTTTEYEMVGLTSPADVQMALKMCPQSGTSADNAPVANTETTSIGAPKNKSDHTLDVFFGEVVTSFRQCLKRYNIHSRIVPEIADDKIQEWTKTNMDFPYYRGEAPNAIHENDQAPADNVNFCKMTLLNYVTPAFVCRRGGLRQKYVYSAHGGLQRNHFAVARTAFSPVGDTESFQEYDAMTIAGATDRGAAYLDSDVFGMWSGAYETTLNDNGAAEVELPMYTNARFLPAKQSDHTGNIANNKMHAHTFRTFLNATDGVSSYNGVDRFVSIAEDFGLNFYVGPPILYVVYMTPVEPAV